MGTAVTAGSDATLMIGLTKPITTDDEGDLARSLSCLWVLVSGHRQLGDLHRIRLHLFQAAYRARLAFLWRLQCLLGRPVRRNVWLSADDLRLVRLAAESLP